MRFSEIAGGAWAFVTGGGALVLAIAYAIVLLQRRRRGGRLAISGRALAPEADARATGKTLQAENFVSCIAGIWLFLSPWILSNFGAAVSWFAGSNAVFGALIAIFALAAVYRANPAEEIVIGVSACWIFASAWLIGLAQVPAALVWSNLITAVVIATAALSSAIRLSHTRRQLAPRR